MGDGESLVETDGGQTVGWAGGWAGMTVVGRQGGCPASTFLCSEICCRGARVTDCPWVASYQA